MAALGDTPLAAAYRTLAFMGILHDWVSTVGDYLAADAHRAAVLSIIATLLGWAVTFTLSPKNEVPSIQASTWWVCAAVTVQCGHFGWMLVWLVLWLGGKGIISEFRASDGPGLDLLQLVFAPLYVPLLSTWSSTEADGASHRCAV